MDNNEIRKQMLLDQQRAFCKQSCTKIDQGLGRLDLRSGERAIWELFQNARDLAQTNDTGNKEAYIKITLTPSEFIFAHQGRAFDHDSLTSLVMQVSSQGKENDETVGQYGTGFLTTHVFGRKLHVSGSLDMSKYEEGAYADINRFVIDRTYDNITEFVDKVAHQLVAVNDFADAPKGMVCRQWTELSYDLSSMEGASETATAAILSSIDVIPYVMTINKPIVNVVMENQLTGDSYSFVKKQLPDEAGLKVMQITLTHNGMSKERCIYYLESEDGEDVAILPLETPTKTRSLSGIAKLFVFFPLLGTEEFGVDAIFHSKKFIPEEARDGLHLPVSNPVVRAKYEQNVRVLKSMTGMVHDFYRSHAGSITGWVNIAGITFDCEHHKEGITKEFFRDFKNQWTNFYKSLPIVDLNGSRVSVNESLVRFFAPEIVADIESNQDNSAIIFKSIYDAAVLKNQLVESRDILHWSKVVASWDSIHPSLLNVDDIAKNLSETENVPTAVLRAFDAYLSQKGLLNLFNAYALIPNRDGVKMKSSELRDASAIPVWLGEISKELVNEKTITFADDSFLSLVSMTPFTRNDLRDAISSRLRIFRQDYLEKGNTYEDDILKALLKLSSVFPYETSSAIRRNTIQIIGEHLNTRIMSRILLPLDSSERDIAELPFKHLVENMLLEISQQNSEWVKANMGYVLNIHSELSKWAEYYNRNTRDGLCVKYGAFPNRNGEPCLSRNLENGLDIPDELSVLYTEVMNADLKQRLVDERFESFCDFTELSGKKVASEIESNLEENDFKHSAVLDIINNLSKNSIWEQWFPHIAAKKAELFLEQVRTDCKESIFKLMKVNDPDKLAQLADLADEVNLDEILDRGRAAMVEKKNREADFNFKYDLGKFVEKMIEQQLSDTLSAHGITVEQEQYGCDLSICKNGNPIYYIEVKSRWGGNQSVMMSPLQMQMSVEEFDNYALCCIDMSHYGFSEEDEHQYPALKEVIPRIKVLTNIGTINDEISMVASGSENRLVHIGGDYKCVVPQSTIKSHGQEFSFLVGVITAKIQQDNS